MFVYIIYINALILSNLDMYCINKPGVSKSIKITSIPMIYSHLDCERSPPTKKLMTGDVHLLVGGFHPSEKKDIY